VDIKQDLEQGSALHEVSAYTAKHKRKKMQICIALMGQELTFAMFEQWKTTLALQPEYGNPVIGQLTGVTWPITLRGLNRLWVLGVHSRSQVRQKAKIGLYQSLMNIRPLFPTVNPVVFICPPSTQQPPPKNRTVTTQHFQMLLQFTA